MAKSPIIRVAGIVNDSITDGPGLRAAIFAQGCPHNCKGCHNLQTHPFDIFAAGTEMTIAEIIAQIKTNPLLDGVTFSGGEPFSQCNGFSALAKEIRVQFPRFDIWSYSGYTYEQIIASPDRAKLLKQLDILVDSPFMEDKMSYALRFRGSSNQRIINVKRSAERGKIVLAEQYL